MATSTARPKKRMLHVGTRTRAFDVLGLDLIVLEYDATLSEGTLERLTPSSATSGYDRIAIEHDHVKGGQEAGHKAFIPIAGAVYRCEGIELVPQRVIRWATYDEQLGFTELTEDQALALGSASAPSARPEPLPDLHGFSIEQIRYANNLRDSILQALQSKGRTDLIARVRKVRSAKWFLAQSRKDELGRIEAIERLD